MEKNNNFVLLEAEIKNDIDKYKYFNCNTWDLTMYVEDIVGYISGFIVRKLKTCINCAKCLMLLQSEACISKLQQRKTYGRLIKASNLIVEVCKSAEKFFKFFAKTQNLFNKKFDDKLLELLIVSTMNHMEATIYDHFGDHLYDGDLINNLINFN